MIITYLGGEFVKVQFGDITLALNPPSKESKLPKSRFGADVVFSTLNDADMNGSETIGQGEKKPFLIQGPGEYEIKDVAIRGFGTESMYKAKPETSNAGRVARPAEGGFREKRINTVYTILLEGMKLCFLGALSDSVLPAQLKEELDDVDILFVPIGGEGVLTPTDANKLAVQIGPKIVIPIHHAGIGTGSALKTFLKEAGEEKNAPLDKLTIKKKDLEKKEGEVVVLKAGV